MDKDLIDSFKSILKEELNPIKTQLEENTNILKALKHKVNVLSAEQHVNVK